MKLLNWGASLAMRILDKMGLDAGDDLNAAAADRTIAVEKNRRREEALASLRARQWTLPPDYKFDREEANER
jgi:antitoxin MazE